MPPSAYVKLATEITGLEGHGPGHFATRVTAVDRWWFAAFSIPEASAWPRAARTAARRPGLSLGTVALDTSRRTLLGRRIQRRAVSGCAAGGPMVGGPKSQ